MRTQDYVNVLGRELYAEGFSGYSQNNGGILVPESARSNGLWTPDKKIGFNFRGYDKGSRTDEVPERPAFVVWEEFDNVYKLPKMLIMRNLIRFAKGVFDQEKNPKIYNVFNIFEKKYKQEIFGVTTKIFPKVKLWDQYLGGASDIENVYVLNWNGRRIPIAVRNSKEAEPNNEDFKEKIKHVLEKHESPINGSEVSRYYKGDNFGLASQIITRGDYGELQDQEKFPKWFVRNDIWIIVSMYNKLAGDKRFVNGRMNVGVEGINYTIEKYEAPKTFADSLVTRWIYNAVEDKAYDFFDKFFDPVERMLRYFERSFMFPEDTRRDLLKEEYKTITAFVRPIFGGSDVVFDFREHKEKKEKVKKAA